MKSVDYVAGPTARKFHNSDKFVRSLLGPIGSGKSAACVMEMLRRCVMQEPYEGVRYFRWVIVRNTYRELLDTTIQTFFDWIPKDLGSWSTLNCKFEMHVKLADGTIMHAEFLFRALDRPDDVKKLLSLEMTGMFINECREIPKAIIDMGVGRLGRYPSKMMGGPTWFGMIMDTNPPDSDHWFYKLFEEDLPDNHVIFHQPSGLSDEAENIENLPPNYYQNMMPGKDKGWIDVYVHGKYGFISDGKPVYPEYNDELHYSDKPYEVLRNTQIYIGIDFGLTPAAVFGQITPAGTMVLFDELVTFDMGAMSFGKLLKEKINSKYIEWTEYGGESDENFIEIYGDPAGDHRAETDEQTPFDVLANQGIMASPTYTNDFMIRRESVADYLMRLNFAGRPAFRLTPGTPTLRKALSGGYKYRRMQVAGQDRYVDKPDKNKFSHVAEAGQYLFLGAVGGDNVVGGFGEQTLDYTQIDRGII